MLVGQLLLIAMEQHVELAPFLIYLQVTILSKSPFMKVFGKIVFVAKEIDVTVNGSTSFDCENIDSNNQ